MNNRDELVTFAKRYAEAWCSQNPDSVAAFIAENGSLSVNDGLPAVGRAAITEVVREFMRDFPDMVVTFDKLERQSNAIAFHWTLTGTSTGPGSTGKRFESADTNFGSSIRTDSLANRKAISIARSMNAS